MFNFAYTAITFYGDLFQDLLLPNILPHWSPTPPAESAGLSFSVFAPRYLRNTIRFIFHRLLRCFSSPGSLHTPYEFRRRRPALRRARLPHSETVGSQDVDSYSTTIAVYYVLLRPTLPRHPLSAFFRTKINPQPYTCSKYKACRNPAYNCGVQFSSLFKVHSA